MSDVLHSYLVAWLFVLGISLGSMANLMVHALTGGRWGEPVRPAWIAATRLMPLAALLALPILIGVREAYPWTGEHRRWLNVPFFEVRSVAILAIWVVLARAAVRSPRVAAAGLIVYTLTVTLAAFDWIASLTPQWYSSAFGLVVAVGQMLAGMAFGVAAAALDARGREDGEMRQRFHDLGNLLLMYVLTWAYLAYTQFLVIWSENLPREIHWYVPRMQTGWAALGLFLVAFHFFLPLAILLSRAAKRSPRLLGSIAAAILVAHLADVFWLVVPSLRPEGLALRWSDPVMVVLVGGVWIALWSRMLHRPLVPGEARHG